MFEDLSKSIALRDSDKGAPNFMIALALCAYTEFWGRLLTGGKGEKDEQFTKFFVHLGSNYEELINRKGLWHRKGKEIKHHVYGHVRSGLVHSYLVEGNSIINMGRGTCGLEHDAKSNLWTFNLLTYFEDFKKAVDLYLNDLLLNKKGEWSSLESAMKEKPDLL